jgi:hypothetical protein
MTLAEITQKLREEQLPPGELSEIRLRLSAEYSYLSSLLEVILMKKPEIWLSLKSNNSDTKTEMLWSLTEDGKNEIKYRHQLKAIEKMISAVRTRLEVMSQEARNQF